MANHTIADMLPDAASRTPRLLGLVGKSMVYRYRVPGWRGPVLLSVSVFDVLVYALALSFVHNAVFQLQTQERFVPMLIALIAVRWTFSCAIQAFRVAHFVEIGRSHFRRPFLATTVLALGPPTFVFLISTVLLGFVLVLTARVPGDALHMFGWGAFVTLIQLVWNVALVMGVIQIRLSGILRSEGPIFFGLLLFLIVSPVAYQFSDIPIAASKFLTSLNPAAHLIAAYQNALWFGQVPSFEVLPWSLAPGIFLMAILGRKSSRQRIRRSNLVTGNEDARSRILILEGKCWRYGEETDVPASVSVHRPWRGELPWVKGRDLLWLVLVSGVEYGRAIEAFETVLEVKGENSPLGMLLPVYPDRVRDRLCVAIALARAGEDALLDGVLEIEGVQDARTVNKLVRAAYMSGRTSRLFLRGRPETTELLVMHQI